MERQADFSGFIGETLSLLSDAIRPLAIFVFVLGGLGATGVALGYIEPTSNVVNLGGGVTWEEGDTLIGTAFELAVVVLTFVASYFLLAALLATRGMLPDGGTRIWAYVGMLILSVLGYIVGFILLIVPGIILMIRWAASSGFLVGERMGIVDSLSASWNATSGKSWSIFFAALVLLIGLVVVAGTIGGIFGVAVGPAAGDIISPFAEALGNAVFLTFGIAVYVLVSNTSQQVSEVFT